MKALGLRTLSCNRRPSGGGTAFVGPGELRDKENFALELASAKDGVPEVSLGLQEISGFYKGVLKLPCPILVIGPL